MNLTALKYTVALAREKHFGRAAKASGVSQPTLSVSIRNLEEELGVQLFERTPMDIRVTSTGLTVVRHALSVLHEIQAIEEVARNSQNPNVGVLRLGVVHNLNPQWMPQLIKRMRAIAPQMPLLTQTDFCPQLLAMLEDGSIDCAVMDAPLEVLDLTTASILEEPLYIAVGPKHPWANLKEIDLASLQQQPLLLPSMGDSLLNALIQFHPELASLRTNRSSMVQEIKGATAESIAHMVLAGMGVAILPRLPLTAADSDDLCFLNLAGMPLCRRIALVWRNQSNRQPCLASILEVLREFHGV